MAEYRYLIPTVSVAPPPGMRVDQVLPLPRIAELLRSRNADLRLARVVVRDGQQLSSTEHELVLRDGEWKNPEAAKFTIEDSDSGQWRSGTGIAYFETHVELVGDGSFASPFAPAFYSIYSSTTGKTFLSDNALKFSNTVTIAQIESFGQWVEGYPACEVDLARDVDESVILINPFVRPALATIDLVGGPEPTKVRIDALSARRVSFASLLKGAQTWNGQVFVTGINRLVVFFCKHSLADPNAVSTLEHSDPYRGEPTRIPLTQYLRTYYGKRLRHALSR